MLDPTITWIAGKNGTGKSSLLKGICPKALQYNANMNSPLPIETTLKPENMTRCYYLDTESMNPRIKGHFDFDKPGSVEYQLSAMFSHSSHGQVIQPMVTVMKSDSRCKGGIFVFDEPEAGISPWEQKEVLAIFVAAVAEQDIQIIAATHSMVFLESGIGSILDLNNGPAKLVPAKEYKVF